jgi:hypothetical protein
MGDDPAPEGPAGKKRPQPARREKSDGERTSDQDSAARDTSDGATPSAEPPHSVALRAPAGNFGELVLGLAVIVAVIGGFVWLAYRFVGGWWGVAAVAGLPVAALSAQALPTRARRSGRVVLLLAAMIGIVIAVASPHIAAHRRAQRLEALAPALCKMFDPKGTGPLTAEHSMIEAVTGNHDDADAERIWARLTREHCPASDLPDNQSAGPLSPEQRFLQVATESSPVLSKLPTSALLQLGHAACTDLANGPLAGAVTDAEGAGFDDFTAGALVGAAAAVLCGKDQPADTETALPSAEPVSDTPLPPPPPTCDDLRRVSATYVRASGREADGTLQYWPRLTVHNGSALNVAITIDGDGKATFNLDPSTAPDVSWSLEDTEHDVAAHKNSTFEPDGSGLYGDATLTVYPGDRITAFTVTAQMTAGNNDDTESPTLTCPLRVRKRG